MILIKGLRARPFRETNCCCQIVKYLQILISNRRQGQEYIAVASVVEFRVRMNLWTWSTWSRARHKWKALSSHLFSVTAWRSWGFKWLKNWIS